MKNTYTLLRNELIDNKEYYVLEILPKLKTKTEYSKHIAWIGTDNFIPLKEKSYDKSEKITKRKILSFYFIKWISYS